jgi:hypothetical protein|tara:strand:+ start:1487 stop:2968 length:1482 start_codon:yes stop_codon:yes gene_type:complete
MAIKRYFAEKDNTITNAFKSDLSTRGTGSNMGASDILETFVIHGQTSASVSAQNAEQSRVLLQFNVQNILDDISNGIIPSSSVEYKLKMYNAPHGNTTPLSFSLGVFLPSKDWSEGSGLDMENYSDAGSSNWEYATATTAWSNTGSDYQTAAGYSSSFHFSGGIEDIELDIGSFAMDRWRSGELSNYGFLFRMDDEVVSGAEGSYYTKRFFGRTSEYFFKRPIIEARWDSARKDNRATFVQSSSLAPATDNINTVYLYNNIRGQLKDIPGLAGTAQNVLISLYSGSSGAPDGASLEIINSSGETVTNITGGLLIENGSNITGIYSASFASTSTLTEIYDVWHSGSVQYYTGSILPKSINAKSLLYEDEYITDVTNLNSSYLQGQTPRLRVFARKKNWQPSIYTVATSEIKPEVIESAYYRVSRTVDDMEILPFGTGSYNYTQLSYDVSGNYFELDTSNFESGYSYNLQFCYYLQGSYRQQPEIFKFRVEEDKA